MSDRPPPPSLAEAEARSRHARARLFGTLEQVQHKLNPMALAQGAVENVAIGVFRDGTRVVRERPGAIASAAALAVLFLVRRPLGRLIWRNSARATTARPASLKTRQPALKSDKSRHPKKGSSK
ncbi:MAG: hypothetical protein CVT77_15165 [Alphaproteobacteria bacterium HGW-Alphaproteobacteria-16]|nr:MAG: hypothetical protein CVT77_15165 [Alphaproteobacteria bacterium HGW-Alphaproteobacteria-16]